MTRAWTILLLSLTASCSSGSVQFGRHDADVESDVAESEVQVPELPVDPAAYDLYEASGYVREPGGGRGRGMIDTWLVPREADSKFMRRFSLVRAESARTGNPLTAICALDVEYEVAEERACGIGRRCLTLASHVLGRVGLSEPCALETGLAEVVDDARASALDITGNDTGFGGVTAWRRALGDRWRSATLTDAPPTLVDAGAYPVGDEILVFGVTESQAFAGGFYKPSTDTWRALPTDGAPTRDRYGVWTWTGDRLLVVSAGQAAWLSGTGWSAASTDGLSDFAAGGEPGCIRMAHGNGEVLLFGSRLAGGTPVGVGAVLNVATGAWRPVQTVDVPALACYAAIHWGDDAFIVAGSDGAHWLYEPGGAGRWLALSDRGGKPWGDAEAELLDVFMVGGDHTVVASRGSDVVAYQLSLESAEWESSAVDRYGAGRGAVADRTEILFGGFALEGGDPELLGGGMIPHPRDGRDSSGRSDSRVPETDLLGERAGALVAYLQPSSIFVWGGCARVVDGTCQARALGGAVLDANLGP